ncbi:MAG: nitroreductase family protein [Bacteroidales bacterium]|jgi:nitroreductase|nr:nitroreductase family protein [Bacteroidales bacterium]
MEAKLFLDFLNERQSVRAYSDKPVEVEKLERCLEAARISPSACNAQPWKFIVVDNPELKNRVADNTTAGRLVPMNHFTRQAPLLVVIVRESPNLTCKIGSVIKDKPYTLMDVGIAALQFCLQATAEGLGTCIMGWFNEKKVKEVLNIPKSKRAELIITLGYAADGYPLRPKIRKKMAEICSYNQYSQK